MRHRKGDILYYTEGERLVKVSFVFVSKDLYDVTDDQGFVFYAFGDELVTITPLILATLNVEGFNDFEYWRKGI